MPVLHHRALCLVLFLLLAQGAVHDGAASTDAKATGLFRTKEVFNANLKPFRKWTEALERHLKDRAKRDGRCEEREFNACHARKWDALIGKLKDQPLARQLSEVNRFMNTHRYIVDPINWGVKDHWATPAQFFSRNGDCEDYAIAKYLTLRRLGIPDKYMRIVVLQDLNLKIPHAVLAIYTTRGALIMDNQIASVVSEKTIRHYRPIYSVNSSGWWLHRR